MITIKSESKTKERIRVGVDLKRESDGKTWIEDPSLLMATVRNLERQHAARTNDNRDYQRLYYQKPFMSRRVDGTDPAKFYDLLRRQGPNLSGELIDAAIALICRRLQPKVTPVGGDYQHQMACKRLGRVIDGVSEAGEAMAELTESARAGMVNDAGFALVDVDEQTGEVKPFKLDQNYVFWPLDGTRNPMTLMTVIPVPMRELIARFPDKEDEIKKIPKWRPKKVIGVDEVGGNTSDVDTVAVATGWLRAYSNKKGMKVTMAGDVVLYAEDYELTDHQVIKFSWKPNANGFGGVPLSRTSAPYDLTNKRLLNRTLSALDGAVPWLLVEEENDVEAISDLEFQRITYPRGSNPPSVVVPNPVSTQSLDRMEANRSSTFREAHVNENAAQGQAPTAMKSAVAQFAWADSVQTILLPQQEAWQRLWRDYAHVVVGIMQTNSKARVRMGDILEEVKLPNISKDKYRISYGLVSGLALTVSGRLEQLQQIQAALPNKLDNEDVLRHIGLPDTQQLADRLLAPRELAEYIVQKALEDGEVTTPPRMLGPDGLAALYRIANQEYCGALKKPRNYYKRENLEVLRRVILTTDFLMKAPVPPRPAPPSDMGAAPMPLPVIPPGAETLPLQGAPMPIGTPESIMPPLV